jgi:hypothetical protein
VTGRSRAQTDPELKRSTAPAAARSSPTREHEGEPSDARSAPPIVHEALAGPATPLDPGTRAFMDARLGYDFSRVRLHCDERAATSAEAVGALAYTVGQDVVFGRGLYAPHTPAGRALLAHELAHVAQDGADATASTLSVGREDDPAERDADRAAARAVAPVREPAASLGSSASTHGAEHSAPSRARSGVLRRTTLGAILGGAAGLLGGVVLGALAGGPLGAVIGGVAGLLLGGAIGNSATTRSRALTGPEREYAHDVFLDSIDYTEIEITRDSVFALGAPRTIGNTIHLKSDWGHFKDDTLELTDKGRLTLIHEMGHVWQYQNGGLAYIPESLWSQFTASVSGGSRNLAYDWRAMHDAHTPWEEWNPEQQAEAIEDYNKLLRKQKARTATLDDLHTLSILLPYIELVRRREGAPTFDRAPDPGDLLRGPTGGGSP